MSDSSFLSRSIIADTARTSNIEELMNKVKRAINVGNYNIAVRYLNEYIKDSEKKGKPSPEAYLMMADIQRDKLKNYPTAVQFYKKYLAITDAEKIKGLEGIAKAYYDWGVLYSNFFNSSVNLRLNYYSFKLEKAKKVKIKLEKAKKVKIVNELEIDAINFYRGLENYLYGRFDDAMKDFTNVSDKNSQYNIFAKIKLAGCYYKSGQKQKADQMWSGIKKNYGKDILIESEIIVTQLESNIYSIKKEAMKRQQEISKLLDQQKNMEEYYNKLRLNLALISLLIGNSDDAYGQIRDYDPKTADTSLGNVKFYQSYIYKLLTQLCFNEAKKYYQECIQIEPNKSDLYNYNIGICYLLVGKFDDAIEVLKKVSRKPLKDKAQAYLAVCIYNKGQKQKAIEMLNSLSKDKNKEVLGEIGYAYAQIIVKLEEALLLAQKSGDQYKIGFVHFQLGLREKDDTKRNLAFADAIRAIDKYRGEVDYSLDKNDPNALITLANLYFYRNIFDESARIWMHFNSRYPHVYQIVNVLQLINETWQMNPKDKIRLNWINQYAIKFS